jgi:hypothetical protein
MNLTSTPHSLRRSKEHLGKLGPVASPVEPHPNPVLISGDPKTASKSSGSRTRSMSPSSLPPEVRVAPKNDPVHGRSASALRHALDRPSLASEVTRQRTSLPWGFFPFDVSTPSSDQHQAYLTRLCCAFRLSQPHDALIPLETPQPCFMLNPPLGFSLLPARS